MLEKVIDFLNLMREKPKFYNIGIIISPMHKLIVPFLMLYFILLLSLQDLKAQPPQYFFNQYTVEDGLSMNGITDIKQDHKGLMWFGSREGLNCWDGYRFTVYKHNSQDPHSLRNNMINIIYEDSEYNFWIGTWKGLDLFDRKHNKFIHYNLGISEELYITDILEDNENNLWISTLEDGLKILNKNDGKITSYFEQPDNPIGGPYNQVHSIYEDRSGALWIGTSHGLYQRNRESGTFFKFHFKDLNGNTISDESFFAIYQDFKGNYWLTGKGWKGLSIFNPEKGTLTKIKHDPNNIYSLSDERLSTICEDSNKNLWIGTQNGLNLYDRKGDRFFHFINNSFDKHSINSNHIKHLYGDQKGILWIATVGGGINFTSVNQNPFKNYTHEAGNENSLSHSIVTSFYERKDGKIWIGTKKGGLNLFNPHENTFRHFNFEAISKNVVIRNEVADNILEDRDGNLWMVAGSQAGEGGLHKYRLSANGLELIYLQNEIPGNLADETIWTLCEDHLGEIWVGGSKGLFRYNCEKQTLLHYQLDDKKGQTYKVYEDRDKKLWIGTKNGLYSYDRENNSFTVHSHNTVYGIIEDIHGNIIVIEDNLIAYRYDLKSKSYTPFYDGTQHGPALGGLVDDTGNFWFNTRIGIIKFNPRTQETKRYDSNDGLISNELSPGAHLRSRNGLLYFGTTDGFTVFHPESIEDNPYIPPVVFTNFRLFNQTVPVSGTLSDTLTWESPLKNNITYTTDIDLTYQQNLFSVEFAALNFLNPDKNQYKYKLVGFNDDWIYTEASNRIATYTNLDPGRYRFIVLGSNNDGLWNETGASIHIRILPPPWLTWWAYLIYFLGVTALLFGSIRFLLIRQQLKGKLKLEQLELKKIKELDLMKTRFFANISHEFRTPLTLIQGPLRQMLARETNPDNRNILSMMERNSRRLLFLINQLLDFSKLETGHMPLRVCRYDIVEFMKKMVATFESMARSRSIHYRFHSVEGKLFAYFDRDKLEKVFINLIHNAFKFTQDGGDIYVKVSRRTTDQIVDKGEGVVEIRVEDNGIGISANDLPYLFDRYYQVPNSDSRIQQGTGIGLALVKDLVKLHHGSVNVTSKEGKGSTFTVVLPLGIGHLSKSEIFSDIEQSPELLYGNISPAVEGKTYVKNHITEESCLLIIDDNPDMRCYLKEILKKDFNVEEACNGREGLEFAIENLPDLIISDVMMPVMDGVEFCRKLKSNERTSHIPLLMLTAKAGKKARFEGFESGADDYITKPFSPDELKLRVRNLITQRKKLRERFSRDITLQPADIAITSADERFLGKALKVLNEKASESEFGPDLFSKEMAMSRAQLHRKLKALTDQSARDFIRSYRLNRARQLLEGHYGNVAEIAYEAGFSNPSYFADCFKKQFGILPSEYAKDKPRKSDI